MKKIFFLLLSTFAITGVSSQSIISFTVNPPNPTTTDTITIITQCMFPSGGCDGSATITNVSGNTIFADAFHCMGLLTVICTDYDTLVIPPLATGNYSLIFTLSAGHGIPCTPGITVDDVDTLNFIVGELAGTNNLSDKIIFQILPNPSDGKFIIKSGSQKESRIKIYSVDGKIIKTYSLKNKLSEIDSSLLPGVYFINFDNGDNSAVSKLVVQ